MRGIRWKSVSRGIVVLVALAASTTFGENPEVDEEAVPVGNTTSQHSHPGMLACSTRRKHVYLTIYDAAFAKGTNKASEVSILEKIGGPEVGTWAIKKILPNKKAGWITLKIDTTFLPTPKPCENLMIDPPTLGPGTGTVLIVTVTTKTSDGTNTSTSQTDPQLNVETTDLDPCTDID